MSGLCGWIGYGENQTLNQHLISRMAQPLARFDQRPIRTLTGRQCAVAVSGAKRSHHLFHIQGLRIAIWGNVSFPAPSLVREEDLAQAVAAQWRRKGKALYSAITGTYALCILDEAADEVFLMVDRMAVHPLVYQPIPGGILFSSTAHSFAVHPLGKQDIDPQAICSYLYHHMIPGPATVYREQTRLLPGQYLFVKNGRRETASYWALNFEERQARPFSALKEEFLGLLETSVRDAARSAQVGAFLSGGTDSSTIAGMLTKISGKPAPTYSIGFSAPGYDEMAYARIAARHFGTDHHEYYVTADDIVAVIPQVAAIFDQPFGNASAVPAYFCARMARRDGLDRLLGGDGGDELFGGNARYAKQHVFSLYERIPRLLRTALLEPWAFSVPASSRVKLLRKARSYIEQASIPMPARLDTYNLLNYYGHTTVLAPEMLAQVDMTLPLSQIEHTYGQTNAESLINKMLALDMKLTLADNDLPKVVKACELAEMEAAFPFLNHEMVEFSARLPPRLKLNGTRLRYFFKEALRDVLPKEIITKTKHGFGLPFGYWLQTHRRLQELASDSLVGLKSRDIIRPEFIDRLLNQYMKEHAGYHGTMVWVLMMLEQWFQHRKI